MSTPTTNTIPVAASPFYAVAALVEERVKFDCGNHPDMIDLIHEIHGRHEITNLLVQLLVREIRNGSSLQRYREQGMTLGQALDASVMQWVAREVESTTEGQVADFLTALDTANGDDDNA